MRNKLFVGGLSWDTDDHSLRAAFEEHCTVVEAKVITDRDTGRSRGFGFVTVDSEESAQKAISELDGTMIDGRTVRVNEAEDKGGGRGGRGRGGGRRQRW